MAFVEMASDPTPVRLHSTSLNPLALDSSPVISTPEINCRRIKRERRRSPAATRQLQRSFSRVVEMSNYGVRALTPTAAELLEPRTTRAAAICDFEKHLHKLMLSDDIRRG